MDPAPARRLDAADVPVIDIGPLREGSDPEAVGGRLAWAATEVGFIYVENHGVPSSLIENARRAGLEFFRMPEEAKREAATNEFHHGWLRPGSTKMYDDARPDLKESFNWGIERDGSEAPPPNPLLGPNVWPPRMPSLRNAVYPFFRAASACAEDLLRGFALGAGLEAEHFIRHRDWPLSRGSLQYYPPPPPDAGRDRFGVAPHTDFGVLTVLCQDEVGGLQIRRPGRRMGRAAAHCRHFRGQHRRPARALVPATLPLDAPPGNQFERPGAPLAGARLRSRVRDPRRPRHLPRRRRGPGRPARHLRRLPPVAIRQGVLLPPVRRSGATTSPATKTIRVATDVGGTFTDLLVLEHDGSTGEAAVRSAKTDTTSPRYEEGVFDGMAKAGIAANAVDFLAHGTTVVINALTERTGVKVGLITTEGFRDTLEIARGNRPDFFNLHYRKPEPFVSRRLRRELPGRIDYHGNEMRALDLTALPGIVADFRAAGVEAVAICFIHSYANPAHEQAALAALEQLWPGVAAISSHEITREWREYERTSTAVLSAYVQPVAERYLQRLDAGLDERGFAGALYIMQSNCGVDSVDSVSRVPITMVESGPASGVWGAAELGRLIGEPNVLALDIGGTTAKCSLIEDAHVRIKTDYWIGRDRTRAGYPVMVPVVDLVEIGNGGGSIAWVDDFGKLRVGPRSAGAVPGPAAYGRGGTEATTTDANLWLGRINRDYFCGGALQADMDAVRKAIEVVGARLGADADEAARGIVRIANSNMVDALKLVSVNRGFDPRDFTLVAFGGGGRNACGSARTGALGVAKVVVPADASVVLGLGHDDVGPAPRRCRHPARRSRRRERRRHRGPAFAETEGRGAQALRRTKGSTHPRSGSCAFGRFRYQKPGAHHRGAASRPAG